MATEILAVGTEPTTELFLEQKGFLLTKKESISSEEGLRDLVGDHSYEAVLLGTRTRLGGEAVELLRKHGIVTPVIRIDDGPRDCDWSRRAVHFLDCGGDNVLEAPPHPEVMLHVLNSVVHRAQGISMEVIRFQMDDELLEVNLTLGWAWLNGHRLLLTRPEHTVLFMVAKHQGPVPEADLNEKLYWTDTTHSNTVRVFVCRLRKKLGDARVFLKTCRKHWDDKPHGYELLGRVA